MQDMPLLIYNANRPRAENAGFVYKSAGHNTVSGDLFQAQRVLLNGKRAMDGADTVGAAQIGVA